jgi:ribA/ribD-fused uncharacterized protein
MGYKSENSKNPREIIVRFAYYPDRETVWNARSKLQGSEIYMKEDFCREIEERRSTLYPVLKAAKRKNMKSKLEADVLIINSRRYTVDTLDKLPPELQPQNLAHRETDSVVLFRGQNSCFSSFYKADLLIDEERYNSTEQYYQYKMAKWEKKDDVAIKILAASDPFQQYRLGKSIKYVKVDKKKWFDQSAHHVMEVAVLAKFNQHTNLKTKLLDTMDKLLAECNLHDSYWSCGLRLSDSEATDSAKWSGDNVLGRILCSVRDTLK